MENSFDELNGRKEECHLLLAERDRLVAEVFSIKQDNLLMSSRQEEELRLVHLIFQKFELKITLKILN